ncbi:MAG TPA: ATP-binding protein [Dehalococcoidia bacterium]|nr:ATP-binding protein [Dehalococcoidia bacterium]
MSHGQWRLRTRLALALLAVFIPIFILVALGHLENLNERRQTKVEALASIDKTVAASMEGFAVDLETFSQSAAITLGQASDRGTALNQDNFGGFFTTLAQTYNVRTIFITDLDGRVLAGSTGNVGFDISSRPYFLALKGGADTVWSGALAGQLSGQTTLAYGRDVRAGDGTVIAYLFVAFYPPQIANRLPEDLPADTNVTLIDNNGVMLLSTANPDADTPTVDVSGYDVYRRAAAGESVLLKDEPTPFDSDERYGAFEPVLETGWVIGLTRPASAIEGPLEARFLRDVTILGIALLAGLGAMVFLASKLSKPLSALASSAEAIGRGESPTGLGQSADPDVRRLELAMTRMADTIAEREETLREQKLAAERLANHLARLHAARNALSTLIPPERICEVVVGEAVKALDASNGAVLLQDETRPDRLTQVAQVGYGREIADQVKGADITPLTPSGDAFLNAKAVFFENAAEQIAQYPADAWRKRATGTDAAAFLPLVAEDKTLGVLVMAFDHPRQFENGDKQLMSAFAGQAAQALHRSQLYYAEQASRQELEAVNATLARSNQAKDEFLGIIAHELRTPLTTIFGATRLLNDSRKNLQPADQAELMKSMEVEASRLNQLVENLLLLARAEMGREPTLLPMMISRLIDRIVANLRSSYPTRQVIVENRLSGDIIESDETSIGQTLYNLMTNAAKYSPDDTPIELGAWETADGIRFCVSDRGQGVSPEELPLIFESFYRSDGAVRKAQGKGIGLAVCRRLVEGLNGHIEARLREGGGLEVSFTLPVTLITKDEPAREL